MKIDFINEVYRKLIHLSSLWMVGAIYILSRAEALYLFTLLLIGMIGFEIARRFWPFFKQITHTLIGKILRPHENEDSFFSLTGAFYVVLAALVSIILFSKPVAMAAISIMILADTAAALIGRKFGAHKLGEKSVEGSTAFFIFSLAILLSFIHVGLNISWIQAIIISIFATALELYSQKIKIDDNLSIVIGVGSMISLFQMI